MSSTDATQLTYLRTRTCGTLGVDDIGQRVSLCGWVAKRREHGEHLAFVDLRDYSGLVQCVVPGTLEARSEWILRVTGTVAPRPEGTVNDDLATGAVEIRDCEVEVLSEAEPPPFSVDDRAAADESVRLKHRFIDLRRSKMQSNLRLRAAMNSAIRTAMESQGFCEVETPLLWTPTPEGAREFAVPSRLHPGQFYVLPQSPQLAKQLLMVSGTDRYYQIARCLRDEDLRADRQFEFTQLDLEASFVNADDVQGFITVAVEAINQRLFGESIEVGRITWDDALDLYGSDKPDLRIGHTIIDCSAVFAGTEVKAFAAPYVRALVVPQGATTTRSRLDQMTDKAKELGAKGLAWFRVVETDGKLGFDSPLDRFLSESERAGLLSATAVVAGDLILVVADIRTTASRVLGAMRTELFSPPISDGPRAFAWVVDFPMFESIEDGNPVPAHHPFTMPHPDDVAIVSAFAAAKRRGESPDPTPMLAVRSQAYDLVLNGWELGSGSIRIHRGDIQSDIFTCLGLSAEEANNRFGFLLDAFRFGVPPHGGFAFGIDRLAALLAGEENIREVIAFPKTQSGADLLTGAPKALSARAMAELHIASTAKPKETPGS